MLPWDHQNKLKQSIWDILNIFLAAVTRGLAVFKFFNFSQKWIFKPLLALGIDFLMLCFFPDFESSDNLITIWH